MKIIKLIIIILTISMAFFSFSCKKKVKEIPKSDYKVNAIHDNWDGTKSTAKSKGKNICLMLHASWCSICNNFIGDVLTQQSTADAIADNMVIALIDGDKDYGKPIFNSFAGASFPTFVITDENGTLILKRNGKMSQDEFINWIKPYFK